jgi:2-oxo-3-hexenedioate decarboxylase
MIEEELMGLEAHPGLVAPFSDRYPNLTPEAGYRAAHALHRHRLAQGWRPVGRKIGFTNRTIWPRYGVYEPIWGMVYDRTLVASEGNSAVVALEGLLQPRIEPEVCFGLKSAPGQPADPAALLDSIDWIAHAVEIVQCPHPGWKLKLADSTAFNGLHGRLVVGERLPVAGLPGLAAALPSLCVSLMKGGAVVDRGTGENVLGSPLAALAHFIEILSRQGDAPPLRAGEIVSTGTLTDAHAVAPGETWSTEFSGILPGLTVRFS